MENFHITDLSKGAAVKIAGMPKLTAWMAGDPDAGSASIHMSGDHGISAARWTQADPAAVPGTSCQTQPDCLKTYIHQKENTMEIFAGVLLCILFLEMLMTIATWHLGKKVADGSGSFGSTYQGDASLAEGVSASDALDGYMKDTR